MRLDVLAAGPRSECRLGLAWACWLLAVSVGCYAAHWGVIVVMGWSSGHGSHCDMIIVISLPLYYDFHSKSGLPFLQ